MLRRPGAFWTLAGEQAVPMVTGHCYSERGVGMGYSSLFGSLGRQVTVWIGAVDCQAYVDGVNSWGLTHQPGCREDVDDG